MAEEKVDAQKRELLSGIASKIRQPDAGALGDMHALAAAEMPDEQKREVVQGIVALLAGAGIALTLAPKEAKAGGGGLSPGDVQDGVEDALTNIIGPLIQRIMTITGANRIFAFPPIINRILAMIAGWIKATPQTFISADPTTPINEAWPPETPTSDEEKRAVSLFMAESTRARVIQSTGIFGAASLEQPAAVAEETGIMTVAIADPSLLTKLNALIALQAAQNARIGTLTTTVAAHGQLSAHDAQRHANEIESQQQILQRFLDNLGELLTAGPRPTNFG